MNDWRERGAAAGLWLYRAMRIRRLGSSGPDISVIGLGAWEAGGDAWGPNPDEAELVAAYHAAFDAGITWVDTAEVYGAGVSEGIVGTALAERRDAVVLATKVAPAPEGHGFRPDQVRAACDASLERLGTDVIDLYQLHWPDETGVPHRGHLGRDGGARRGRQGPRGRRVELRPSDARDPARRSAMSIRSNRSSRCWCSTTAT